MSLISRGQAALVRRMKASAGVAVVYARGVETAPLTAWVGRTLFARVTEEVGPSRVWGERDYLFAAADLVIGGELTLPREGDRVTETIDGSEVTFEVVAPQGEPAWRYSDQTRQVLRIHCKRVPG